MLSSQLLELRSMLAEEQVVNVETYIGSFNSNTKITASKFAMDVKVDITTAKEILKKLIDLDVFSFEFGIRCPECGLLVDTVDNIYDIEKEITCYNCDVSSEISTNNVEVIYSIKKLPFVKGHQNRKFIGSTKSGVLTEDSLETFLKENNYNLNEITYSPTDEEYELLKEKYNSIFEKSSCTTKQGKKLENLVIQLFNLCRHFEITSDLRLQPNQIDCYVRNKLCAPGIPGLKDINNFCIECKNEKNTPRGEYMNKLHSILKLAGMSFGIIISKAKEPSTFKKLANQIYLSEKIVIIWFNADDLENIIFNKHNLLDCIDKKIQEIKLNATKDLSEIGLYK